MKLGSAKAWARTLGFSLAHVQDGVDRCVEWGFAKLKQTGDTPKKEERIRNPYLKNTLQVTRGTLGFLGLLGENYYRKYEELKRKA